MKPLRLKMQAFGSYGKETTIDFEKVNQNLFLITGDTGAGKTTIFDAIVFALYGEASSSLNKKEGVVLQSQYVDFDSEPYVELVFSEGRDEKREIYTVRRVPRHLKTITRGANKGKPKENTGSVSLIMPDGLEYPSKEADRKLQETVGLTKSQFMLVVLYFAKFRHMHLERNMFKPQLIHLKAISSLGLSSCINQIAIGAVQIVMNNTLRYYGASSVYGSDIPIACVGIVSKVNMVFLAICIGIAQGAQPIWGFNYGAKKYDRVRQAYRYSATACTIIATFFFLCFQIFPHQIISMFGGESDLYFKFAENYLRIFMLLTFANGIQPMSAGFFTSIGKAGLGIIMSLTRQVIFLLPLVVIFPIFMGIDGVMYAGPIADTAAFVLAVVFARRELGKMKKA